MPRRTIFVLLCLLVAPLFAQSDKPAPFSEVEQLRIQNVQLEGQIVQRAIADWRAKVAKLKADIEAARPGYVWNPDTGDLTTADPVKK